LQITNIGDQKQRLGVAMLHYSAVLMMTVNRKK